MEAIPLGDNYRRRTREEEEEEENDAREKVKTRDRPFPPSCCLPVLAHSAQALSRRRRALGASLSLLPVGAKMLPSRAPGGSTEATHVRMAGAR